MREVRLAVTQMSCSRDREQNIAGAVHLVREAAASGANIVVLQELFETPYFCMQKSRCHFDLARPLAQNPAIEALRPVAAELGVVVPVSFFERADSKYFNTLAMIDADGTLLGTYRKSHIPDFDGYEEAFYFSPGDTGFRVFDTRAGRIGAAICWDQWFPEAARCMVLKGAEILVYPTAIGNEPRHPDLDSKAHWQQAMQGHAAANLVVVAAANRVGTERSGEVELTFYGGSFIADQHGKKCVEACSDRREVVTASFDLDAIAEERKRWGIFRTRRHDLYAEVSRPSPRELHDFRVASIDGADRM